MELLDLCLELGRWSMEGIWLPLLVWTAVSLPVYIAVRLGDGRALYVRYWALVALLLSLPVGLAAAALTLFDGTSNAGAALLTLPAVDAGAPLDSSAALEWTTWHTAGAAFVIAVLLAIWRCSVLAGRIAALRTYRRSAQETPSWLRRATDRRAHALGLRRSVSIRLHATGSPFTYGWIRPVVVLPLHLIDSRDDVCLTLTHELIHIRRCDYVLQVLEQLVGAVFFLHPLVALLRRETSTLREITCDADVISQTGDRSTYARLLYRFSTVTMGRRTGAVGIFSREHQLQQRIRAMKTFFKFGAVDKSKQIGIAAFGLLLVVAVVAVACSEMLVESDSARSAGSDADTFVVVEEMPELIGGLESIQKNIVYPELAKQAGVEGRVIVQFVVNEEGGVTDAEVVRGVGSGLDAAALEAVRAAQFKPGRQRGEPVEVKMSLPVTFKLAGDSSLRSTDASDAAPEVDELPRLDGGLQSVQQHLRYPASARDAGVEGRVIVAFTVDAQGRVVSPSVVRGVGSGLDEAALEAVRAARFSPATKDGRPVAARMSLPITFRLPGSKL